MSICVLSWLAGVTYSPQVQSPQLILHSQRLTASYVNCSCRMVWVQRQSCLMNTRYLMTSIKKNNGMYVAAYLHFFWMVKTQSSGGKSNRDLKEKEKKEKEKEEEESVHSSPW